MSCLVIITNPVSLFLFQVSTQKHVRFRFLLRSSIPAGIRIKFRTCTCIYKGSK